MAPSAKIGKLERRTMFSENNISAWALLILGITGILVGDCYQDIQVT